MVPLGCVLVGLFLPWVVGTQTNNGLHLQEWLKNLEIHIPPAPDLVGIGNTTGGLCSGITVNRIKIVSESNATDNSSQDVRDNFLDLSVGVFGVNVTCAVEMQQEHEDKQEKFVMNLDVRGGNVELGASVLNKEPFPGAGKRFPQSVNISTCAINPEIARLNFAGESATRSLIDRLNENAETYKMRMNSIPTPVFCTQLSDRLPDLNDFLSQTLGMILFGFAADDVAMLPQYSEQPFSQVVDRELYNWVDNPLLTLGLSWISELMDWRSDSFQSLNDKLRATLIDGQYAKLHPKSKFEIDMNKLRTEKMGRSKS